MANSPRPGIWALEKSDDYGKTYKPWQYFADTPFDCENRFKVSANQPIRNDDDVICTTDYSKVLPVEGGEILVSLVNNRPMSKNFTHSDVLQSWTRATNVRLRLLRTKNLLGHLMAVAKQDPTVTRRYFYSIRDISIGGRCVCNGHAQHCDESNPRMPGKLICRCSHNTCGDQCQTCCPGFVQKQWKPSREGDDFECEPCQCYGHSDECIYDEEVDKNFLSIDVHGDYKGGGVCQNCRHNTHGNNCELCNQGYYRPFGVPINSTDACQRCNCNNRYSTGNCADQTGQCECKEQYDGQYCEKCAPGFTDYPTCRPCDCNVNGRADNTCGEPCHCKFGYLGPYCDKCVDRYYGFPTCSPCDCDREGSNDMNCDPIDGKCVCRLGYTGHRCDQCDYGYHKHSTNDLCTQCTCDSGVTEQICHSNNGTCICKENFQGEYCNECSPSFYNFPNCFPCECDEDGSRDNRCSFIGMNKQCNCQVGRGGATCNQCAPGYYKFPECIVCNCDVAGTIGRSCDPQTGKCKCKPNFMGDKCSECAANLYNYPICEECRCHPDGVSPEFPGCSKELRSEKGIICPCKEHVTGRQCDICSDRFYGLGSDPDKGCTACECFKDGTLNELDICDKNTVQCHCKLFSDSLSCDECESGTFKLQVKQQIL
jgi:laminin, alpha 3/5